MLDVCLLGTGGMMPLPNRWLTSLLMRHNGKMMLIDCGEGTQIPLKMAGWGFKAIEAIFFTHYHADHISGLPGLLLTIGNSGKTDTLHLFGPPGLQAVVKSLLVICPALPFDIRLYELPTSLRPAERAYPADGGASPDAGSASPEARADSQFSPPGSDAQSDATPPELAPLADIGLFGSMSFQYLPVNHNMACIAYSFTIRRQGVFFPERAKELEIPLQYWKLLQAGSGVRLDDGRLIEPEMVMGAERKGIKISYCTDSRPTARMPQLFGSSDLLVCEGLYGDDAELENAASKKHMVFSEAARLAKSSNVGELWLTHYSPAFQNPRDYVRAARAIFPNAKAGSDLMSTTLVFENAPH
jgi:ribonuclease Z